MYLRCYLVGFMLVLLGGETDDPFLELNTEGKHRGRVVVGGAQGKKTFCATAGQKLWQHAPPERWLNAAK